MAKIQARKGVKGTTYRVEVMRDGVRSSKSFKTKKEAERFAAHLCIDEDFAASLSSHVLNNLTLDNAVSEYLARFTGRDTSRPQVLRWWLDFIGGSRAIGKIARRHVKDAMDRLSKEGKAPATQNRYKAALSALFAFLCDHYDIKHNPAREVRQKHENNAVVRFLSEQELAFLLTAAKQSNWPRLYLLIILAITTGARRSNLLGLRWQDIDLKQRTAIIQRTKNGQATTLTLTGEVVEELLKFRDHGEALLFHSPRNHLKPFIEFDHHWRVAKGRAKLNDFRFHDLRHTCASLLAMSGASLLEIADVLGHKTISMTQRYAHLCHQHKAELTERVLGRIAAN